MNKKILHTVFAHTANEFAKKTAIVHGQNAINYEDLNVKSTRMSLYFREMGVKQDVIVGIALERSIEYIASIIAVMKAGGIFLPLDMKLPEMRLDYILTKSRPKIIIIGASQKDTVTLKFESLGLDEKQMPMIEIDQNLTLRPSIKENGVTDFESHPEDSLYIMYTSGSTGAPKAILGQNKSLSHFVHWEKKEFELDEQVKVTQLAPVTFDASLRDIFTPLICGGTVCIPEDHIRSNIQKLIQWVEETEISLIHCVPSFFRTLMKALENQSAPKNAMPKLQYILMAGEALYGRDIIQWMDLMGDRISLVNLYGPSETTLIKTFYPIKERPSIPHKMIPVGKPISNTSVLILKKNRLCDIGEMGDIYIKTPFMTKGYYNDPQLTAKSFVQNPLNEQPDIIYKTGDLGRYLPDRIVEFIGRADNQVKVNGIRIELADIEKNLLRYKAIDQAVVMVHKNQENENTLVCYYTEKQETSIEAIRQFLADQLPSYMTPSFYIKLDAFPLTITGKLDQKSLPKPEALMYAATNYEAPTNETENKLAAIWADILELKKVGINNSFFEIGGHSLKAVRMVSRIYKELKIDVSLKDFFENVTIKKLAQFINRSEKRPFSQIQPVGEKAYYDLSHAQRRMWIMDQMDGGGIAYNSFEAILIDGHLNVALLKNAIETVIQRHESLRTTFEILDGEPKQFIHPKGDCLFQETDLSQNQDSPDTIKEKINETAKQDAIKPFDLSTGPLMRIHLLKITQTQYALLFNIHHIVSDAWSLDILSKEVLTLYESFIKGDHTPLPTLRIQYKDYANWQNQLLKSEQINPYQLYWHQKLSGEIPVLNLPIDYPRPPVQTFNGKTISFTFDYALTKGLFDLSKSCDVTIFMCIHALLKALLFRYTGKEDIIIGAPVAGRDHFDLENQIGFYVNILALRDNIQKNDSFKDLLSKVKQTTTEAYAHQLYPFDRLVDDIDNKKDISRPPIFSVAMTFYENPQSAFTTKTLNISSISTEMNVSKYDFIITFTEIKGCLEFNINFNSELFHEDTINRLACHLKVMSKSIIKNPDCSITTFDILDPLEKDKILFEFNDTRCEYPKNKNMIQIFTDVVRKYPDNTAVIYEDKHISYEELDRYSDLLAGYLKRNNVQHEEIVGVFIDKSELLVMSFLGILKSGAAYLPVDPEYPIERIRHIIEDSQCNIILTEEKYQLKLKDLRLHSPNIRSILKENQYTDNIENVISPESLAYIIYTSGSTGKPKGSMNIHKGPVNMALDQIRSFGVTELDHILQFSSSSFDASIYEMCMALFSGAAITIVSSERKNDPERFTQYLIDKNVTVATLPPVYLNTLDRNKMKTLKTIITAGEAAMVQDAVYYSKNLQYINAYGPSEASVCISFHRVDPERQYLTGIPIGKPISNTCIYILDEMLQPVPVGIPGEICVSGEGLGRGYLNRENLTKEKFIPHPFKKNEVLYKTGDIGKWHGDGNIEFLGRIDEQVKIRGYRIELGEIENRLTGYSDIHEAVVLPDDRNELIAYIVTKDTLDLSELKSYLSQFLPVFMMPSYFVRIQSIPLTTNGKVDKKALPDPKTNYMKNDITFCGPRNKTEEQLVQIWQDVLQKDLIGIYDNFFEIGGNSLHSVKLTSIASSKFNKHISVKLIFLYPTIAELAKTIDKLDQKPDPTGKAIQKDKPLWNDHIKIEKRPITTLLAMGEIPSITSAVIQCLDEKRFVESGLTRQEIIDNWCNNAPIISDVHNSILGSTAIITIPTFLSETNQDPHELIQMIIDSIKMGGHFGAKTVSLTASLHQATDFGQKIISHDLYDKEKFSPVTTGIATIAAGLMMSIEKICHSAIRTIEKEIVGILGLDPIGKATLRIMLKQLPHPEKLILCDPYKSSDSLDLIKQEIMKDFQFKSNIKIVQNNFDEIYNASVIIGTMNETNIIDISKIKSGTLLIDCSVSHTFDVSQAISRLKDKKDILFTDGSQLCQPSPYNCTLFIPENMEHLLTEKQKNKMYNFDPSIINTSVVSGLLMAQLETISADDKNPDLDTVLRNYEKLKTLGFRAPGLHCENFSISDDKFPI